MGITSLIFYTLLVVNCHRIILLGNNSVSSYGMRFFSKREWRFTKWLIAIYLLLFLLIMLITLPTPVIASSIGLYATYAIYAIAITSIAYLFSRLSLILPATAVDYDPDVYWAWDITKANGWRLVIIICVLPLISSILISLLNEKTSNVLYFLLSEILTYSFIIFEIFALSLSFKYLHNNSNGTLGSAPTTP